MIRYKLTNQENETYGHTKWKLNEWKETSGEGDLCGSGWLHFYSDPLLAVLLNPIHANIDNPKLYKAECSGKSKKNRGLKEGWTKARIIKKIALPKITNEQKIKFAILCALEVYKESSFVEWSDKWIKNKDRSTNAANAAANAAYAAANAAANAAYAAANAAANAANAAAYAAGNAAYAAGNAAANAAYAAGNAAANAAYAAKDDIDFIKIAKEAMK